jgi:phenylacetate-CoA ligase
MNKWVAKNIVYNFTEFVRNEHVSKYLKQIAHIPYQPRNEIIKLQEEKLRETIITGYNNIPFYRKKFNEIGLNMNKLRLPDDLLRIPILKKQDLQENYEHLINPELKRRISRESTSGSSGKPLVVIKDRDKSAYIRAVMYRCYMQYGIEIGDKQARFWGMPINKKGYLIEKMKDIVANRVRLAAFMLNDKSFSKFAIKMQKIRPRYFCGYPSLIYKFSQWFSEKNVTFKNSNLSVIITTGEVLYDFQRELMEKTFNCKVANEYGATESGIMAFECHEGNLHINSDHVYLETVVSGGPNGVGDIVITELNNKYNPLIRYELGDVGEISYSSCRCGVEFPILKNILGRQGSFIITPDNQYVYSAILSYTLKGGIKQFQGIQNKKDELVVRIVKENYLTEDMIKAYKQKLSDAIGYSMKIKFDFVAHIEPDKSGKLRYFISNINRDE